MIHRTPIMRVSRQEATMYEVRTEAVRAQRIQNQTASSHFPLNLQI